MNSKHPSFKKTFARLAATLVTGFALATLLLANTHCSLAVDDPNSSSSSSGSEKFSLTLASKPSQLFRAVYLSIDSVQIHKSGAAADSWISLTTVDATVNLQEFVNGKLKTLADQTLDAGTYDQLRFLLNSSPNSGQNINGIDHPFAHYAIQEDNAAKELKLPNSAVNSLTFSTPIVITDGQDNPFRMTFDWFRSIILAGSTTDTLLSPTVSLLNPTSLVTLKGNIRHAQVATNVADVLVIAETQNPAATDPKDAVTLTASTFSDADGNYALSLPAGVYNVVFVKSGYKLSVLRATADTGAANQDTTLTPENSGFLSGTATVNSGSKMQIDIRQTVSVLSQTQTVSLATFTIQTGGTYTVKLPAGTYKVVVSADSKTTTTTSVDITSDFTTTFNPSL